MLDFTVTQDVYGTQKVIELIPGGTDVELTDENKGRYIELRCAAGPAPRATAARRLTCGWRAE